MLCHLAWVIVLASAVPSLAAADPAVWRRQVIYLVMPDRFHNGDPGNDRLGVAACFDPADPRKFHGGDIDGVRQKIDYLRALGVTAVWITPVYRQIVSDGSLCGYHGYWPDFADPPDGAIEPKLGTAAHLSALSSALHARGLKLILDMVVNHAGYGARVVTQHPDWFHPPDTCAAAGDPEIVCPLAGLPDFRQELDGGAVTNFLIKETTGWLARFPVDGIRMDTAKHVRDGSSVISGFPPCGAAPTRGFSWPRYSGKIRPPSSRRSWPSTDSTPSSTFPCAEGSCTPSRAADRSTPWRAPCKTGSAGSASTGCSCS
jgi:hypothetical protein